MKITVTAGVAYASECLDASEYPGAMDVDVDVDVQWEASDVDGSGFPRDRGDGQSPRGETWTGAVTLIPSQYDGTLCSWGDPEHWVSGALLRRLRGLPDAECREVCGQIEAAARTTAEQARRCEVCEVCEVCEICEGDECALCHTVLCHSCAATPEHGALHDPLGKRHEEVA